MAPDAQREAEINWRLSKATSIGLAGEIGVHHFDMVNWYLNARPLAVTGFGSITAWKDGRDVPDTIQCVVEYPNGVNLMFSSTLGSSFSNTYTLFQGNTNSLMLRDKRAWMVKENDAPLLGWEVYARKEPTMDESGIALVADATKLLAAGKEPGKEAETPAAREAISFALENFTRSIRESTKSVCGPVEAYQAAVVAIKANEAVNSGSKIAFQPDWFELK
jgi:predicted dehydrogenase